MQHFTRKFLTFVGAIFTALAAFAGNGTPASPFTAEEVLAQREALAKSQQEVFVKADFVGFGTNLKEATQTYISGDNFLVGTATTQLVVRGTNYAAALEHADSKHNWVMRGHFAVENESYVFVAEELNGALQAVVGAEGIGTFSAKANFTLRHPELQLVVPRVLNKERQFRTAIFKADNTIAGVTNGYSQFLVVGKQGTYDVTLLSQDSNIRITSTILYSGTTTPTLKNRTFYRFVAEDGKVGFRISEDGGKTLQLNKPTEIYLALNATQLGILKEVFKLDNTDFIPMSNKLLTSLRALRSSNSTADAAVYDLNGRRLGTADQLPTLPQGIYVVNGQKVVR